MTEETKSAVDNELANLLQGEKDVNLSELQSLIDLLLTKEFELAKLEDKAKDVNQEIQKLKTSLIPEKMGHLTEIKLASGKKVTVQAVVRASILKATKDSALTWLEDNGHGSLIKTEVSVPLSREERALVPTAMEALQNAGFTPVASADVHPQTLSAWVREQLEAGAEIPSYFSVYQGKTVTVKETK